METGKESTKSIRPSQIRMSGGKRFWRKVYVPCPLCEKRVCDVSPYHDIFRKSLIPLTEMEKLMGKQDFQTILGDLIVKPAGKPTLVPASDKRPAITSANTDFMKIKED